MLSQYLPSRPADLEPGRWVRASKIRTFLVYDLGDARIHQLNARPELNGRPCCIAAWSPARKRFIVYVSNAGGGPGGFEELHLQASAIEVWVPRLNGTPGMFEADVVHHNDLSSLDEPEPTVTIVWKKGAQPAALEALDNKNVKVTGYDADRGLVTICTAAGMTHTVGCGLLEMQAVRHAQKRRVSAMNNVDPLAARQVMEQRARDERRAFHYAKADGWTAMFFACQNGHHEVSFSAPPHPLCHPQPFRSAPI